jgi:hypothetical protein
MIDERVVRHAQSVVRQQTRIWTTWAKWSDFREARLMWIAPVSQEMVLNHVSQHVLGLPGRTEGLLPRSSLVETVGLTRLFLYRFR